MCMVCHVALDCMALEAYLEVWRQWVLLPSPPNAAHGEQSMLPMGITMYGLPTGCQRHGLGVHSIGVGFTVAAEWHATAVI